MSVKIKYGLLRYVHSRVLQEQLNVGVIVNFIDSGEVKLFLPTDFNRLNNLYTDFRSSFLKTYLKALQSKTEKLNKDQFILFNESDSNESFLNRVLRPDDTSLEFSEIRSAQIKSEDRLEAFISGFLPHYYATDIKTERHNEDYLRKKFKKQISQFKNLKSQFSEDKELKFNNLSLKIDFEWQNGTTNLVKAVSFDLYDKHSIDNKLFQSTGYLSHFHDYVAEHNARFDLLIAKPTRKGVFKDFDKAIELLDAVDTPKKIILENQIEDYSQEAIDYLSN